MRLNVDTTFFIIGFILLLIANTSSICAQEYPILTDINGVKVVIWTLDQDKENSIQIEKFRECDSLHRSLQQDFKTMREIQREDSIQYENIRSAFEDCQEQKSLESGKFDDCQEQRENDREIIKQQKKTILRDRIVGGVLIVLLVLIAF